MQTQRHLVSIKFEKPLLELLVQDNGNGFVYLSDQGHYVNQSGIANMTKRAKLINALLSLKVKLEKVQRSNYHIMNPKTNFLKITFFRYDQDRNS